MRAAAIVTEWELLDQQHGLGLTGQMIGGSRAHCPRADNHVPGFDVLHVIELGECQTHAESSSGKSSGQLSRWSPGRLPLRSRHR